MLILTIIKRDIILKNISPFIDKAMIWYEFILWLSTIPKNCPSRL